MNEQSILFKVTVWVILIVNVFYTVSSFFITSELFDTRSAFSATYFISYLAAVVLLVENGTLIRSKLIYLMAISITCVVVGTVFKIQHWELANETLLAGLCLSLCTYLLHFFRKSNRVMLDYLKLVWVLLYIAFYFDSIMHFYILREWIAYAI